MYFFKINVVYNCLATINVHMIIKSKTLITYQGLISLLYNLAEYNMNKVLLKKKMLCLYGSLDLRLSSKNLCKGDP